MLHELYFDKINLARTSYSSLSSKVTGLLPSIILSCELIGRRMHLDDVFIVQMI